MSALGVSSHSAGKLHCLHPSLSRPRQVSGCSVAFGQTLLRGAAEPVIGERPTNSAYQLRQFELGCRKPLR